MDPHFIRHARTAFALAIAAMLAIMAPPAHASPRTWQPLLIRGAQIPQLIGANLSHLEVLADHDGVLGPIPFQSDEVALDGTYALPKGPNPTVDDSPGVLDAEDEVAMMVSDLGDRALFASGMPPGAIELEVSDPLGGPNRYAYIAEVQNPRRSPISYISYDPKTGAIESGHYRLDFVNNVAADVTLQNHEGEKNSTTLDRFKFQMRARLLGLFRISLGDKDVSTRVMAWKAGPIRVIRRTGHSVRLMAGVTSNEALSDDFYYRDYFENPFTVEFPALPSAAFSDVQVRVDFDFSQLKGYSLMWSGMKRNPVQIGDFDSERQFKKQTPGPDITWIALRGGGRTTVQTLAPVPELGGIKPALYFRGPGAAAATDGAQPALGYVLSGWEGMSSGAHSLDSLLITAPGDYSPELLFRELHMPPIVHSAKVSDLRTQITSRRGNQRGARLATIRNLTITSSPARIK